MQYMNILFECVWYFECIKTDNLYMYIYSTHLTRISSTLLKPSTQKHIVDRFSTTSSSKPSLASVIRNDLKHDIF